MAGTAQRDFAPCDASSGPSRCRRSGRERAGLLLGSGRVTMKIVASRDGTLIACEQGGRGPHLVLVHGTSSNSSRWEAVRPRLEEHFTVTRMDRRGRGGSGDSTEYAIEREFEDVATVVNTLDAPYSCSATPSGLSARWRQ